MPTLRLDDNTFQLTENSPYQEITFEAWREGARTLQAGDLALIVPNDSDLSDVADALAFFDIVILEFPKFGDGRAYSQARMLRDRYGFDGEIRARGDILRDQALFMARAGIDAFEIEASAKDGFIEALQEFSFAYQAASDQRQPIWRLRAQCAAAA